MKNKQIGLVLSLLAVGVLSGCSNAKQEAQLDNQKETINEQKMYINSHIDTINMQKKRINNQNKTINEQKKHLHNQNYTIERQGKQFYAQGKAVAVMSEEIESLVIKLNAQEKSKTHTVKAGDTLLKISRKNHISLDTLVSLNPWLKDKGLNAVNPNDVIKLN